MQRKETACSPSCRQVHRRDQLGFGMQGTVGRAGTDLQTMSGSSLQLYYTNCAHG